jgi:hypothetical protein
MRNASAAKSASAAAGIHERAVTRSSTATTRYTGKRHDAPTGDMERIARMAGERPGACLECFSRKL